LSSCSALGFDLTSLGDCCHARITLAFDGRNVKRTGWTLWAKAYDGCSGKLMYSKLA
jgi:hypothetical protein